MKKLVIPIIILAAALSGASVAVAAEPIAPDASAFAAMPECKALQAKYPALAGKKLVIGLGGYNKGFQSPTAADPNKLEGLDPDLFDRIGACLGFTYDFQMGSFNVLVTSIASGRVDMGPSLYVTEQRTQQVSFISTYQVINGAVVPTGNPKKLTSLDSLCGATVAAAAGTYEAVNVVPQQTALCEKAGKPKVELLLVQNTDNAIQTVQSGRADIHITSLAVARALVAGDSKLEMAFNIDLPIRNGYPVAKTNVELKDALRDAFKVLQATGVEKKLLEKWGQGGHAERPVEIFG
ncbi:transporter substrate-binding domain-containing protein [Microvirga calopogonii]|uniref:transporter substrate-binding domain-containing protein n=1 Tax=Microvirga calopogonii TaxID=2078013 RepID=UPI000E0CEE40|nr:transporter substrate-binding domain-containing protein [Microvirga calopogonii]